MNALYFSLVNSHIRMSFNATARLSDDRPTAQQPSERASQDCQQKIRMSLCASFGVSLQTHIHASTDPH